MTTNCENNKNAQREARRLRKDIVRSKRLRVNYQVRSGFAGQRFNPLLGNNSSVFSGLARAAEPSTIVPLRVHLEVINEIETYTNHRQSHKEARQRRMTIIRRKQLSVRHQHRMEALQHVNRPAGRCSRTDVLRTRTQRVTKRWGFGRRSEICPYCKAFMWKEEKVETSTNNFPKFGICCQSGQIMLPLLPPHPEYLDLKFKDSKFKEHIRSYNSMLSFTSMGGKIDRSMTSTRGPYSFRIGGENAHRIGSLLPPPGEKPKFAQLYIYDTAHEIRNRVDAVTCHDPRSDIDQTTVEGLQSMLNLVNPYVKVFRNARDIIQENGTRDLQIRILNSRGRRQYVKPVADEVAALIVGDGTEEMQNRDIIISTTNGMLKRIDETHPSYMPLQYPLLFPFGTDGWRRFIPFVCGSNNSREGISMRQFYAFRLQCREEEGQTILLGGRLLQQYSADCFAAIEQNRLRYIKLNQSKLRADLYKGLEDAVTVGDTNATAIGKRYILPSSFTGGPRNMIQRYQDAMAICRAMGTPDYFITFTCNPNWPEIQEDVRGMFSQRSEDRPDIVARVFRLMLKNLMKDMHVIEFQKRGLPHAHILLTVDSSNKLNTVEEIDGVICAELPNKDIDPLAFATVTRCMIHGPCGIENPSSPCMIDGQCSKRYPRSFCNETSIDEYGFVVYRRRDTGSVVVNGRSVDNRWVVPYNRDLTVKYDAHINVEKCARDKCIKYLYKYMHQGSDRATILIEDNAQNHHMNGREMYRNIDEIKQYLDCRYVSSIEACWRIFEFDLQQHRPSVERLQFHLPDEQFVIFHDNDNIESVFQDQRIKETMFTMWFETNRNYPHARRLTYVDFPSEWVWNKGGKKWTPRKRGYSVGRLYYVHPNSGERYFLRMLLNKVKGATSFEDIKTVNGLVYTTFKEACLALGLLEDDNEWHAALGEASTWATGSQLRNMFCSMLMFSEVTNPHDLWESYWKDFSEDLQVILRRQNSSNDVRITEDDFRNFGLFEIEKILNQNERSLNEFPQMPMPTLTTHMCQTNRLIREELDYDVMEETQLFSTLHAGLNDDQLKVFNAVMDAYTNKQGGTFFVYGSGGTGKTYLWRTMIARFRHEKKIVLSVASSAIASLLLPGGRTAHSRFKIPIDIHETSCCSINLRTDLAELIKEAALIIWDEAVMMSRYAFEAVDRTFQDIMKCDSMFGGKIVVLGGDFRQILPVVAKGGRAQTVGASLQKSQIWTKCEVMKLTINMRVLNRDIMQEHRLELQKFAEWIKDVGEGKVLGERLSEDSEPDWITIPKDYLIQNDEQGLVSLIDFVYPDLCNMHTNSSYLKERSILAPKNCDVDEINAIMLSRLEGDVRTYNSADRMCPLDGSDPEEDMNPPELLNSMNFSNLPNHCLQLKVGAPIMLLRNLNQSIGLCNGTRLVVEKLGDRVIEARTIMGPNPGEIVLIPRIELSTVATTHGSFIMKRRQFPIKLAFAMTINKSQGQTLKIVGLYLPHPVFTHGQLYVAISHVTSPSGLKILMVNKEDVSYDCTRNVVYKEVFNDIS